jgi:hypothetical protein
MWKKVVVAYLKALSWDMSEGTDDEELPKVIDSRDTNPAPPKYKTVIWLRIWTSGGLL